MLPPASGGFVGGGFVSRSLVRAGPGVSRVGEVSPPVRIDEELLGDGHSYSPKAIHSWLTRVMYNRRSKINPLWNTVVIGGFYNGER